MRNVRFPHIHVKVSDAPPIATLLERVADAFRRFGVPDKVRKEFREAMPSAVYALQIDEIRNWVETD